MNFEKYILIGGPNQSEIIQALQLFSNNYANTGVTNNLELFKSKSKDNFFVLNVSNQMDLERFKYLINFIEYPFDIKYDADVRGYWTIAENDNIKKDHLGQRVMFYLSPNDTEYDNVFGIFKEGDKAIKFGFASREEYQVQEKKEIDFIEATFSQNDFELVETINPDPSAKAKKGMGCLVTFTILILAAVGITLTVL